MELTIGADPELFVKNNGGFISGHVFELGTKDAPFKTEHGAVQVDGLALEFNVNPSSTRPLFVQNVRSVLDDLNALVAQKDATAELVAIPTVTFGSDYLNGLPEAVKALGCNPDFSAYTGQPNVTPDADRPFRTGAGHVHLGYREGPIDYDAFDDCCKIVKELDFYLGLPSLSWDGDTQRRELYGAAGAFRPKPYGLEYRTLSNAWVPHGHLIGYVFDQTKKAYDAFLKREFLSEKFGDFAREMINGNVLDWRSINPAVSELVGENPGKVNG